MSRQLPIVLLLLGPAITLAGPPPAPPPPRVYEVVIRYEINAFGNARIVPYFALLRSLGKIGFQRDPDEVVSPTEPEDPAYTRMRGTLPANRVANLLALRPIRNVLLIPQGEKLPADKDQPVRVDLDIKGGLAGDRQKAFADQTAAALQTIGFRPALSYDHRGYHRLLGSLPAGQLDTILEDLRKLPGAAVFPLLKRRSPIQAIHVQPGLPIPSPVPAVPPVPKGLEKVGPGLRTLLAGPNASNPTRMDVILASVPNTRDPDWAAPLVRATRNLRIEDQMGRFVTVFGPAQQAAALAAVPEVQAVRLSRAAQSPHTAPPGPKTGAARLLEITGLTRLHTLGRRGQGSRIAVVAGDFAGLQQRIGKELPADTQVIDFTRQRNRDLTPDPYPTPPDQVGPGTQCALTALRAAPEAKLTVIRVDPASPGMLQAVVRAINGERYRSPALERNFSQLELDRLLLEQRREELLDWRATILETFRDREAEEPLQTEPRRSRKQYEEAQAKFDQDWKTFRGRMGRLVQLLKDIQTLGKIDVVASGLVWEDGYPVDGGSPLSRYLDDGPFRKMWVQAGGDAREQAWAGLFRDTDGNELMEFSPAGTALPEDLWTRELNFLAWQQAGKRTSARELPAGAKLRVSVQWQEGHDSTFLRVGEDPYRIPLTFMQLLIVHQPDPEGKTRPADDLEVVAQSSGFPQRLRQTLHAGTYEQTLEFEVQKPGRYAVILRGRLPEGTRPADAPTLPALQKQSEIRPRLFVVTGQGSGRAVFHSFHTDAGTLGMPADAHRAITVGAADDAGQPQPYSSQGPPHRLLLLQKPDVLAHDQGEGSFGAACFAAGLFAVSRNAGVPLSRCRDHLPVQPGELLRIPAGWPKR